MGGWGEEKELRGHRCTTCSVVVPPVFVCDIDGTLGDYHIAFAKFCWRYWDLPDFGDAWDGSGEMEDYLGVTKEQYREAKLAYRQGGNKRWMPVYQGASLLIDAARGKGAEIWIATTRPYNRLDNIDPDTREWMRRNRINFDHMLYGEDKYRQVCERIDPARVVAVLDDLPELYDEAVKLGLPAILRGNTHNVATRGDRFTVDNLYEASSIVRGRIDNWREAGA